MIGSFPRSGVGICRRTRKWSAQFGIVHAASSTRRPPRSMQRRTQSRRIYQISGETCQFLIWLLLQRKWRAKYILPIRQAALMWSKKYCDSNPNINLKEVLSNFLEFIRFHQIPANVLMREIHPIGNLQSSYAVNRKCGSFHYAKWKCNVNLLSKLSACLQ